MVACEASRLGALWVGRGITVDWFRSLHNALYAFECGNGACYIKRGAETHLTPPDQMSDQHCGRGAGPPCRKTLLGAFPASADAQCEASMAWRAGGASARQHATMHVPAREAHLLDLVPMGSSTSCT
jgi:hypothetical protein